MINFPLKYHFFFCFFLEKYSILQALQRCGALAMGVESAFLHSWLVVNYVPCYAEPTSHLKLRKPTKADYFHDWNQEWVEDNGYRS